MEKRDKPKVSVTERSLLVAPGQSKKLAEIRKSLQPELPVAALSLPDKQSGLKSELATELGKASKLIDKRINEIMSSFPEGKKKRLFSYRFGSVDEIKAMPIKAAFKTLAIDEQLVKMKLVAELNVACMDVGQGDRATQ